MADGLEFVNLAEFEARAAVALKAVGEEAKLRVDNVAEKVADTMRQLCPVSPRPDATPGELRDSIDARPGEDGRGPYVEVGSFGVRYAGFVELGTSKMRAEPFARPALAQAHNEL